MSIREIQSKNFNELKIFFLDCGAFYIMPEYYIARNFWRTLRKRLSHEQFRLCVEFRNWLSHANIVAKKYYRFPSGAGEVSQISILSVNLAHRFDRKMQMLVGSDPFASSSVGVAET